MTGAKAMTIGVEAFCATRPLPDVKSPFPETKDAAWRDATPSPSFHIAAEHHVAEETGWRRTLEVAGAGLALASALGGVNAVQGQVVSQGPVVSTVVKIEPAVSQTPGRSTNPPTQPVSGFAWFAPDADLPAHDDAPLRFGDIVRKVADMAANMAIKEFFAMVGRFMWEAIHARRKHLTTADEDALKQLDRLLGDENSWVRHVGPFVPPMPEEAWEEVGEQVVKNSHGLLRPFLCGEKSPAGAGADQVTDWIAERTRDALFSATSDTAIWYIIAGIGVAIAKEGLDKICGVDQ
jgi:hypothetical protein